MHFRLKFPLSRKRYEIGTDPVNIKHPVMRVSQHQLSFLFTRATRNIATATWLVGWVSVTRRYCIKTTKPILKLFRPSRHW